MAWGARPARVPALTSRRRAALATTCVPWCVSGNRRRRAHVSVNSRIVCFRGCCVPVGPGPVCAPSTRSNRSGAAWLLLGPVPPQPGEMPFPLSVRGEASGILVLSWVHDRVRCGLLADLFLLISEALVPLCLQQGRGPRVSLTQTSPGLRLYPQGGPPWALWLQTLGLVCCHGHGAKEDSFILALTDTNTSARCGVGFLLKAFLALDLGNVCVH